MEEPEYNVNDKDDWLESHLGALIKETLIMLDIKDLKDCSLEEKELFKIVLAEEVKRKYRTYDNWEKNK